MTMTARVAVSVVFLVNGFVLTTWFARTPTAAAQAELSTGQLGVALLGMAAGALAAGQSVPMLPHFAGVAVTAALVLAVAHRFLLPDAGSHSPPWSVRARDWRPPAWPSAWRCRTPRRRSLDLGVMTSG